MEDAFLHGGVFDGTSVNGGAVTSSSSSSPTTHQKEDLMRDLQECEQLLSQCKRPRISAELSRTASKLRSEIEAASHSHDTLHVTMPPVPIPSAAASAASGAGAGAGNITGSSGRTGVASSPSDTAPVITGDHTWNSISDFAWDQSDKFVSVYIMNGMEGVGSVPRDRITCTFSASSLDVKICGFNGKDWRLLIENLDKEIVPGQSKILVKPNKIVVRLAKKESLSSWFELTAKKKRSRVSEKKEAEDPSASIMNMMRDLYNEGDDTMKRTIAEAWEKSRRGDTMDPSMDMGAGF